MLKFLEKNSGQKIEAVVGFADGRTIDNAHHAVGWYVSIITQASLDSERLLKVLPWGIMPIGEKNAEIEASCSEMLEDFLSLPYKLYWTSDLKMRNAMEGLINHTSAHPCCAMCKQTRDQRQDINLEPPPGLDENRHDGARDVKSNGRVANYKDLLDGLPIVQRQIDIMHLLFRTSERLLQQLLQRVFKAWRQNSRPGSAKQKTEAAVNACHAAIHRSKAMGGPGINRFKLFLKGANDADNMVTADYAFGSLREKEWLGLWSKVEVASLFPPDLPACLPLAAWWKRQGGTFAKLYTVIDTNKVIRAGGAAIGRACRLFVDGLIKKPGQAYGCDVSLITPYFHALRNHIGALITVNGNRGLRSFKCSNFERQNLTDAHHLRTCNSRRAETTYKEMLFHQLRLLFNQENLERGTLICDLCSHKPFAKPAWLHKHRLSEHGIDFPPAFEAVLNKKRAAAKLNCFFCTKNFKGEKTLANHELKCKQRPASAEAEGADVPRIVSASATSSSSSRKRASRSASVGEKPAKETRRRR